jgi:hypothetical protein
MDGFAFDDESQFVDMDTALNGETGDGVDRGARVVYQDAEEVEAKARLKRIFGGGDGAGALTATTGTTITGKGKEKEKEKSPASSTSTAAAAATSKAQPQLQARPKPKPRYTAKALQLDDEEVQFIDPPLPPLKGGRRSLGGKEKGTGSGVGSNKSHRAQNGTRSGSSSRRAGF